MPKKDYDVVIVPKKGTPLFELTNGKARWTNKRTRNELFKLGMIEKWL
jgi:hypothetical protein